jgi:hypothetical protein
MALKRIHKEIADIKKEDLGGMAIAPTDNLFLWNASIPGQEGSPYEGGLFRLEIHLPNDYPCVTSIATTPQLLTFHYARQIFSSQDPLLDPVRNSSGLLRPVHSTPRLTQDIPHEHI